MEDDDLVDDVSLLLVSLEEEEDEEEEEWLFEIEVDPEVSFLLLSSDDDVLFVDD